MSEELQKTIDTVLNGTTSKTGIAIKLLAQLVDNYNMSAEQTAQRRQEELLTAINNMSAENAEFKRRTDEKFKGLEVVSFFATHKKVFWIVASAVLVLVGAGAQNLWTMILK